MAKRKTHIGIVLPYLKNRGTENQAFRIATGLQSLGYSVTVFNVQGWGDFETTFIDAGISVVSLGAPIGIGEKRVSYLRLFRLALAFKKHRCDVVLSRAGMTNFLTGIAARLRRVPSIVVVSYQVHQKPVASKLCQLFFWAKLGFATRVVAVSQEGATNVIQQYPLISRRVVHIANGVDVASIEQASVSEQMLDESVEQIVYVGSIEVERKGLDTLIDAMRIVHHTYPTVRLLLIGTGEDMKEVQHLAKQNGIGTIVDMVGEIRNPYSLMAAGSLFVMPSRREGLNNAMLEAMALGLPVIATKHETGAAEIVTVDETGVLTPVGDVAALADACIDLLQDQKKKRMYGIAGKKKVSQEFSLDGMIDSYHRLVEQLR